MKSVVLLNSDVGHGVPVPPTLTLFRSASMNIYRRLYEQHFGPIPKGCHIHHRDGDRSNNHIDNLQCVSVQEHYDIHYSQGDYGACWAMVQTGHLSISPEERSFISSQTQLELSKQGKHLFQTESIKEKTRKRNVERNKERTGKTYDEIYGVEKAEQIRSSIGNTQRGVPKNLNEDQLAKKSEYCKNNNPMHNISEEDNKIRIEKIKVASKKRFETAEGSTKNKICYTDGLRNIFINPEDVIPDGFYKGMTRKAKK